MAIFVTGDTHGAERIGYYSVDGFIPRLNMKSFPEQKELSKQDVVIICGDFGGVWETNRLEFKESAKEKYGLDWLEDKPFTTLFVPGNHENYDRLTGCKNERLLNSWLYSKMPEEEKEKLRNGYPRIAWCGGHVRVIRPYVLMLEPGVFDIDGCRCFAYGGAASHDISGGILDPADYSEEEEFKTAYQKMKDSGCLFRVKGVSWWEQEIPGTESEKSAIAALEDVSDKVDFIFTHAAPLSCHAQMGFSGASSVNRVLEFVKN